MELVVADGFLPGSPVWLQALEVFCDPYYQQFYIQDLKTPETHYHFIQHAWMAKQGGGGPPSGGPRGSQGFGGWFGGGSSSGGLVAMSNGSWSSDGTGEHYTSEEDDSIITALVASLEYHWRPFRDMYYALNGEEAMSTYRDRIADTVYYG
ncbi:hypothetical protein E2562_020890 [Oryza meyeriana var. granulata]|uniref:Uncharacterized protein n=1 Tax=Oryza meyeriana var. granulata TaxID=110450 RepID=A0A6G1D506_9ORYZ|nr:hypothetical protein E2562_020890 [Oryza meyeriana var. granulata]